MRRWHYNSCTSGIGGSDLGPRAIYLALENWARTNDCLQMNASLFQM